MSIKELNKEMYQDYPLNIAYETSSYYDIEQQVSENVISFTLVRKKLGNSVIKNLKYDLFSEELKDPKVYALIIEHEYAGIVEIAEEKWTQRLRIHELYVPAEHRNKGYGTRLINHVKELAKQWNYRAIVLETQSCNTNAIDLYLSQGFLLTGLDTTYYANNDIESKEIKLEFVYLINEYEEE